MNQIFLIALEAIDDVRKNGLNIQFSGVDQTSSLGETNYDFHDNDSEEEKC